MFCYNPGEGGLQQWHSKLTVIYTR